MSALIDLLIRHEGMRHFPYTDAVGKWTIGVGRNLSDNGISTDEAIYLLQNDVNHALGVLRSHYPWFSSLDASRQDALADMMFNLGGTRFAGFRDMIAALEQREFDTAAAAMLASQWAVQVGGRAQELAGMVATGRYPTEI